MKRRFIWLICASFPLVSGCIDEGSYPSLDVRPIEKIAVADEPEGAPAAADDAPLPPDLAAAVAAAEAGDTKFRADVALAGKAVAAARGMVASGEAWVAAQQAVSRAQASRVPVGTALDALDAAMTGSQRPATPALTVALDRMTALDAQQGTALAALSASLFER